jgi:lysyl-tRNA synthetase class 2
LLAYLVFRPFREEEGASNADRERARNIVENYGSDSLAYFNLRSDKQTFFHRDSFLAYKVVGDVAVISGDPVGPADNISGIVGAFHEYCLDRGWRLSILGASGNLMPYYEEAGLRGFELGEAGRSAS